VTEVGRRRVLQAAGGVAAAAAVAGAGFTAGRRSVPRPQPAPTPTPSGRTATLRTDVLVAGAGFGGVAAAYAVLRAGHRVVLTDRSAWIGGQATAQAVPPDEHRWVDQGLGATAAYLDVRRQVRDDFRHQPGIAACYRTWAAINPGLGTSPISAPPAAFHRVLDGLLAPYRTNGSLVEVTGCRPVAVSRHPDGRLDAVRFATSDSRFDVHATMVVDGSDLGDLLPIAGVGYRIGMERSRGAGGTGELHNPATEPHPEFQQAFTMVLALGWRPGRPGTPIRTSRYRELRHRFTGLADSHSQIFDPSGDAVADSDIGHTHVLNLWNYRRVRWSGYFTDPSIGDLSLLNIHQTDTANPPLIPATGVDDPWPLSKKIEVATATTQAGAQYFQTDYPRPGGGGSGFAGLFPAPAATGTPTGIAQFPYVREARRLAARLVLTEGHVGVEQRNRQGRERAATFRDAVAIGAGPIDIHDNGLWPAGMEVSTYPFQIPLRALLPARGPANLLAGGKTVGATHLANGCLRFHVNEWSIGEAAGCAAAWAVRTGRPIASALADADAWRSLTRLLHDAGVQRAWPRDLVHTPVETLASGPGRPPTSAAYRCQP